MEKKIRQSNFELLRIISMILIVMRHCDGFFGLDELYSTSLGVCKLISDWLRIGGQIGVGCFILVSGYFMVEQNISTKKMLKLAGEVWFYTISIWLIWVIWNVLNHNQPDMKVFLSQTAVAFFPILFSHYWFVTAYFILMVLSPFFNKLIFSLDEKKYRAFLFSLIIIFVLLGGGFPRIFSGMFEGRLIPVFILYFIAGYIRRFGDSKKRNSSRHFFVALIFYLLLFASVYFITYLGIKLDSETIIEKRYFYSVLNSPFIVIICVELFICFWRLDIKYSKTINTLASCTFGVYLLHMNRLLSSFFEDLFPIYKEQNPLLVFIYSLLSVLIIYLICSLIDYVRKNTVEKVWILFLDKKLDIIQNKIIEKLRCIYSFFMKVLDKYYNKE
ncbi:MAG: acyltransferase [Oscillospiraceae bacterium]